MQLGSDCEGNQIAERPWALLEASACRLTGNRNAR